MFVSHIYSTPASTTGECRSHQMKKSVLKYFNVQDGWRKSGKGIFSSLNSNKIKRTFGNWQKRVWSDQPPRILWNYQYISIRGGLWRHQSSDWLEHWLNWQGAKNFQVQGRNMVWQTCSFSMCRNLCCSWIQCCSKMLLNCSSVQTWLVING